MSSERVHVRNVQGRYPRYGVLHSDNIEAEVIEELQTVCIRLNDDENPEFWLELTLEVERD